MTNTVRTPPTCSGRDVVGAATTAAEGAYAVSLSTNALRTTASR
jgi:hypothetical protein